SQRGAGRRRGMMAGLGLGAIGLVAFAVWLLRARPPLTPPQPARSAEPTPVARDEHGPDLAVPPTVAPTPVSSANDAVVVATVAPGTSGEPEITPGKPSSVPERTTKHPTKKPGAPGTSTRVPVTQATGTTVPGATATAKSASPVAQPQPAPSTPSTPSTAA